MGHRVPTDKMAHMYWAIRYIIKGNEDQHVLSTQLYEVLSMAPRILADTV